MKNLLLSLSILSLLAGSAAFAVSPLEELLNELKDNPKCLEIAKKAVNSKKIKVDWSKFNFKDPQDDAAATQLSQALDSYLGKLIAQKYREQTALSPQTKDVRVISEYEIRKDEVAALRKMRDKLSQSWSEAFSKAFAQ